jgi:carbon starvation protein
VVLLVAGIMVANPTLAAPAVNPVFAGGGGPNLPGAIFPFVFICIMCGAISGFHALVSSGTTPKMISKEGHVRTIGYGAMLIEGLVGVVALLAAAALPQADYWAINIDQNIEKLDPKRAAQIAEALEKLNLGDDRLADLEQQVGGESLRGRTGGAVTLAVGMSEILTTAMDRVSRSTLNFNAVKEYWYHFALMFEALFILTTIDTGTRIARFLLQEALGKVYKPLDRVDWMPGAVLCTALVTAGWGVLIWTGSIDTIWPMFGIANQLLAAIALCVVTSVMIANGKGRYWPVTVLPLLFVTTTTITAAVQMIRGKFADDFSSGIRNLRAGGEAAKGAWTLITKGSLNIGVTSLLLVCFVLILADALPKWYRAATAKPPRVV